MGKTYQIKFAKSGITAEWDGSHENLLELAESCGVEIPYACRSGIDSVCQTVILEGSVEHPESPMPPDDETICLPCCAVPCSDLILDA
jgi:ferredoxin